MTFTRSWRRLVVVVAGMVAGSSLTWNAAGADSKDAKNANVAKAATPEVDADHAARMARGLDVFKKQVRTVLEKKCLRCHGGKKVESEFDLGDRAGLLKGGAAGPAIIPGKAKDSLLYKLITHAREPHMPEGGAKLPADDIAAVASWIDLGAPYDKPLVEGKENQAAWIHKVVPAEARQFWSFQPLQRVAPPAVQDAAWCKTPIDRFVLAKLEAARIKPNPAVSKQQLIRRTYFDLHGLPPTPAEVDAFVQDNSADAYDRLLDRLLSNQHYGERWARHWLDLARFGESHGFEHDYDRPAAYHFRDFVIQALNDDLPYDTFVKWQIAGDEIAADNNLALKATGYLAAGVHSTQITKKEVEKHRYDELDDMLATIGTSMLGLTLGCARCHDHKFDPIPQRDYYRLLSTFTTTVRSDIDLNLDPEGYKKVKAAFDQAHAPLAAALAKFESEQLPTRFAVWEKSEAAQRERFPWIILDPATFKSEGGATFTKLEDGSLLASGKNPNHDTYTITVHTGQTKISGIRLEAMADPSFSKSGPGRAANGNFALSDFRVTIAPRTPTAAPMASGTPPVDSKPVAVPLKNPRATFEQKSLPIAAAIDSDDKSAWAVDPQIGKDHAAVFETDKEIGFDGGSVLTFTLKFKNNNTHNLGRLRLALASVKAPTAIMADSIPESVLRALDLAADKRSKEQQAAVLKWYRTADPEWQTLNRPVQAHQLKAPKPKLVKCLIATEGLRAVRLHTQGSDFFKDTHFLRRGDPEQKEGIAAQGFLQVLTTAPEKRWQREPPQGSRMSYRRRALADWLTDVDQGAGRLLARVIVNRLWQHHLGRGIVATPSDFGVRGDKPTHPELLDWLATELIQNGWRLKPIHKLIMTSAVYRESADMNETSAKVDGDNKLLWRRPQRRLEAEVIRDTLLAVSGQLDPATFGPGTLDQASKRRSIYLTVKRSKLIPMMVVFDAPEALGGVGERPTTTIAPQALFLMNNPNVRAYAHSFARRTAPDSQTSLGQAVKTGYLIALTRTPTTEELTDTLAFLRQQLESYKAAGKSDARELALADFCQALMCLNEFVYVE